MRGKLSGLFLAGFALLLPSSGSSATRVIPDDLTIQAFVRPSGNTLRVVLRVPTIAFNDVQFPMRAGGNTDVARAQTMLPGIARYRVADLIEIDEEGVKLPRPEVRAVHVSAPNDHSFANWDDALGRVMNAAPDPDLEITWGQTRFDMLLEYPIRSENSGFSIRPHLGTLGARVSTELQFLPATDLPRSFQYQGDPDVVRLNPSASDVFPPFFQWGFSGSIFNTDYLLIVFCLILPLRRTEEALPSAIAFLSAGAVTLFSSAAGLATDRLWFEPLIQTLTASTILIAAAQNMAGGVLPARRALEALLFGLIFGFDFAFGLGRKAQFAGTHESLAATAFGAGTLLALLLAFAILPPCMRLLFSMTKSERTENVVLSLLAAHAAWHWMTERWDRLSRFSFQWPVVDAAFLALVMRWAMILVIFGGAVWLVSGWIRPRPESRSNEL